VRDGLPEGFDKRMEETLCEMERTMQDVYEVMFCNAVFKKRTVGVGYIDPALLDAYGVTGAQTPARAGVAKDVRKDQPYLVYPELDFEPVIGHDSDIYTRADVRRRDVLMSIDLVRQILAKMPRSGPLMATLPNVLHWKISRAAKPMCAANVRAANTAITWSPTAAVIRAASMCAVLRTPTPWRCWNG